MKISEWFVILFISIIFILSCIAPFLGVDYSTTTITDLGFFKDVPFIHHTFAFLIFLGCPLLILINTIKKRNWIDLFYVFPFVIFACTLLPICEWVAFWTLCIYILKEIILYRLIEKLKTCSTQ